MKKKKVLLLAMLMILTISILAGCINKKVNEQVEMNSFKQNEVVRVAKQYLQDLKNNDMEGAKKLYVEELINNNKYSEIGELDIRSFILESVIESGDGVYAIFDVIRSPKVNVQSDLDKVTVKVVKENSQYKIAEVKSVNKAHIFDKNNSLRMVGEEGSKSELVVNLSSMPTGVYIKDGEITLKKELIVNKSFGPVALSYTGEKIVISTLGDNSIFISVGEIEKTKETQANPEGSLSNEAGDNSVLEGVLERPIARKIIPMDILKDVKVENLAFSELEEEVIVEYTDKSGYRRMKIYEINEGKELELKLDEMLPKEKYNLIFESLDKKVIFIKVVARDGAKDISEELLGEYKIDLNESQITKI